MKNFSQFPPTQSSVNRFGMLFLYLLCSLYTVAQSKKDTTSYIQTLDLKTGKIDTVLSIKTHFEAPNWHPDNYLVLNSKGKIYTLDLASKKLAEINTGFANQCNNDHGISPDKKWLVVSHNDKNDPSKKSYKSAIFLLPIAGGEPKK